MTQTRLDLGDTSHMTQWLPTRAAALERLNGFVAKSGSAYARERNFDRGQGQHSGVSQLSPWVRHRLLLEEEVLQRVLSRHGMGAAEKFIQEVFWRGYFKGWLEHRPQVWQYYKQDVVGLFDQLDTDAGLARRYDEATAGQTGIACFDAWAGELVESGYLHNHARMWFASIWVYTLQLPWQLGADFFFRHLLDGDPASNTCSWRWVCGLHTVGKTYLARASNIEKFTLGRFNPVGELAAAAPALEDPRPIAVTPPRMSDPELMGRRFGLILTEEDCHPESLGLPRSPASILAFTAPTDRSIRPLGHLAKAFAALAVQDAIPRAEAAYGIEVDEEAGPDWAGRLRDWAAEYELEACVVPRLSLGPVRTRLQRAAAEAGIEVLENVRDYDRLVWPHAKRGFFGLKKKIPGLLRELGLA